VWTIFDPYHWERQPLDDTHEGSGEDFGECTSDNLLIFMGLLVAIMMTSTAFAGFMAWKTKDVSEEFAETKWIFYAIFAQIQVWVVSIPVIVLVKSDGSTDVAYVGSVLVIFTFAVTMPLLIIGPRVAQMSNAAKMQLVGLSRRSNLTASSRCFVSGLDFAESGSGRVLNSSAREAAPSTANDSNRANNKPESAVSELPGRSETSGGHEDTTTQQESSHNC